MTNCIFAHDPESTSRAGGGGVCRSFLFTLTLSFILFSGACVQAQTPLLGTVKLFAGNFPPRGWMDCDGSILSISQNTALFSLLGTTYGGNGTTTFALPDLRSRVAIHTGQGPGLSSYSLGQSAGVEAVTLTVNQIPAHNHSLNATTSLGSTDSPAGAFPARAPDATGQYSASSGATMAAAAVGSTGGSQPHNNVKPYLALRYVIAVEGIYPSRP